jgi:hypothetical protein
MALMAIGTNAIPTFIKMFQAKDPMPGKRLLYQIRALIDPNYLSADVQHQLANEGFEFLGPKGLPAAPALAELMRTGPDTQVRLDALDLLKRVNAWEVILPALTEMFKHDPDPRLRRYAAGELVVLFPEDAEKSGVFVTFPEVRKYLDNP